LSGAQHPASPAILADNAAAAVVTRARRSPPTYATMKGNMQNLRFQLQGEFIALCDLLKVVGLVDSGGAGKALVAAGNVRVDGRRETRKTCKIRGGQRVEVAGARIAVVAAPGGAPASGPAAVL
jgi:ribosome-associated protein